RCGPSDGQLGALCNSLPCQRDKRYAPKSPRREIVDVSPCHPANPVPFMPVRNRFVELSCAPIFLIHGLADGKRNNIGINHAEVPRTLKFAWTMDIDNSGLLLARLSTRRPHLLH